MTPARDPNDGRRLRRMCPVIRSLTGAATVRGIERELTEHMSRGEARRLISDAKEQAALNGL